VAAVQVSEPTLGLSTYSDANGHFAFRQLAGGELSLQLRRIGYAAVDARVELRSGSRADRRFTMSRVSTLDSVRVTGERVDPRLREFEENRRIGLGTSWFVVSWTS
jgi:hypothetical protein